MNDLMEQYKQQIVALQAELERREAQELITNAEMNRMRARLGKAQALLVEMYHELVVNNIEVLEPVILQQSDEEFFNIVAQ